MPRYLSFSDVSRKALVFQEPFSQSCFPCCFSVLLSKVGELGMFSKLINLYMGALNPISQMILPWKIMYVETPVENFSSANIL